jgi:hypothetical protein
MSRPLILDPHGRPVDRHIHETNVITGAGRPVLEIDGHLYVAWPVCEAAQDD